MPKNAQINTQLYSFHILVRLCSKSFKLSFSSRWTKRKQGNSRKRSTSVSLTTLKPLTVWSTTNCGIFLKRWEYQDHLTCLLRNLCAGQEATVRSRHGTMDWVKIGNRVQGYMLSPCLFNLNTEPIMRNAGLDESQTGIKISGRNINNLRYTDDNTLMAESEEELKSLLMRVKEEREKAGLKLNIQKLRSWHPIPSLHGR